jgi:TRAP-type C4-dicarboxylate transport system substrate-binding protein
MSTLEIKGGLLDMISKINDKKLLLEVHQLLSDLMEQRIAQTDFWDELSTQQQKQLDEAISESYEAANLISHETVLKKYKKWLND